jgi:hypothetical protein
MEVDDFELLELVNDYQERCEVPTFNTLDDIPEALMIEALYEANYIEDEINDYMMVEDISISKLAIEEFKGDDKEWESMEEKFMEKTTRKLNDLLSQFLSLRNEVSEIADKTTDAVFDSVESGDITKEEALTILTDNKLLPVANWICLPNFMDDCDYFNTYSTIYYMDYMYPQNFGNHEYASWSEMSYEEGINELYDFVKENRVIGYR